MRPQLFRAAARYLRASKVHYPKTFATTTPRAAEVDLTIGMLRQISYAWILLLTLYARVDGQKVSIEGSYSLHR